MHRGILLTLLFFGIISQCVLAAPGGFAYKRDINIENANPHTLSDFQIYVVVDTKDAINNGRMRSDCGDIRFYEGDTKLSYWIEPSRNWEDNRGCNTNNTVIWIKVPSIVSGNKVISMYYGSPTLSGESSGSQVFDLFDDFSGTSLDTNKWTFVSQRDYPWTSSPGPLPPGYSISSGKLTMWAETGASASIKSVKSFDDAIVEFDGTLGGPHTNYNFAGIRAGKHQAGGSYSYAQNWNGQPYGPSIGIGGSSVAYQTNAAYGDKAYSIMFKGTEGLMSTADMHSSSGYSKSVSGTITQNANSQISIGTDNTYGSVFDNARVRKAAPAMPSVKISAEKPSMTMKYRKPIYIYNSVPSELTNYQVLLKIDTATLISQGKMRSDCGDIRFYDDQYNGLSYWMQEGECNRADTKFYVKIPSIPASYSTAKHIYMYYSNPSATSVSNGRAVFDFFDDAEQGSASDRWHVNSVSYTSVAGRTALYNYFNVDIGNCNSYLFPTPKPAYNPGQSFVFEADTYVYDTHGGIGTGNTDQLGFASNPLTIAMLDTYGDESITNYWNAVYGTTKNVINPQGQWVQESLYRRSDGYWKFHANGHIVTDWTPISNSYNTIFLFAKNSQNCKYMQGAWDNIRVRKLANSEPTYSFGSEQTDGNPPAASISVTPSVLSQEGTLAASDSNLIWDYTFSIGSNLLTSGGMSNSISSSASRSGLSENTQYNWNANVVDFYGNSRSISNPYYTKANGPTSLVAQSSGNTITLTSNTFPNHNLGSSGYYFECVSGPCHNSGWITTSAWTDSGLELGTEYKYKVKFRNGDGVETAYSDTVIMETQPKPPVIRLDPASPSSLSITIESDGNPSSVKYSFYDSTTQKYLSSDKTFSSSEPVWKTSSDWSAITATGLSHNTKYTVTPYAINIYDQQNTGSPKSKYTHVIEPSTLIAQSSSNDILLSAPSFNNHNIDQSGYYFECVSGCNDSGWVQSTSWTDTGLSYNTSYSYRVKYRNGDGVETGYSSSVTKHTRADVPKSLLFNSSNDSTAFVMQNDRNPPATLYALEDINSGKYLQADGVLGDITWMNKTNMSSLRIRGLNPNASYSFMLHAMNGDSEIGTGPVATVHTKSNSPSAEITALTQSSLRIALNPDGNPSDTEYTFYEESLGKYLSPNGRFEASSPAWKTKSGWGDITVYGLSQNTRYKIAIASRNAVNEESKAVVNRYTRINTPSGIDFLVGYIDDDEYIINMKVLPGFSNLASGASRIEIRSTTGNEYGQDNATLHANEFTDIVTSPNRKHCYRATAFNGDNRSENSVERCAYSIANIADNLSMDAGNNVTQILDLAGAVNNTIIALNYSLDQIINNATGANYSNIITNLVRVEQCDGGYGLRIWFSGTSIFDYCTDIIENASEYITRLYEDNVSPVPDDLVGVIDSSIVYPIESPVLVPSATRSYIGQDGNAEIFMCSWTKDSTYAQFAETDNCDSFKFNIWDVYNGIIGISDQAQGSLGGIGKKEYTFEEGIPDNFIFYRVGMNLLEIEPGIIDTTVGPIEINDHVNVIYPKSVTVGDEWTIGSESGHGNVLKKEFGLQSAKYKIIIPVLVTQTSDTYMEYKDTIVSNNNVLIHYDGYDPYQMFVGVSGYCANLVTYIISNFLPSGSGRWIEYNALGSSSDSTHLAPGLHIVEIDFTRLGCAPPEAGELPIDNIRIVNSPV